MSEPLALTAELLTLASAAAADLDQHLAAFEKHCQADLPSYQAESVPEYWEALMEALERHGPLANELAPALLAKFGEREPWLNENLGRIREARTKGKPLWGAIFMLQLFERGGSEEPPEPKPPRPIEFWLPPLENTGEAE